MTNLIVTALVVGMVMALFTLYRLLSRRNEELRELRLRLAEHTSECDRLYAVLDSSPDIIIITDGEHLITANETFFKFFRYETLEAFRAEHDCICDFFEKVDDVEYLHDKKIEGQLWPFYLLDHPEIEHKVQMTVDEKILFFSIKARRLKHSENQVLVELSDITDIESQKKNFQKMAITDKLTGIINRLQFDVLYSQAIHNAKRYNEPLSLIMFDIDFFKNINDRYGHDIGDRTLVQLAKTVSERLRCVDIFARWGGEEFMILLPKTELEDAVALAEELREVIMREMFDEVGHITISFGVSVMEDQDEECSLLKRVDQALYAAKNNGRNRVESFCPSSHF